MTTPSRPGSEPGDWTCRVCGQYASHKRDCVQPSGRCARCGRPIDEHDFVDTPKVRCPMMPV